MTFTFDEDPARLKDFIFMFVADQLDRNKDNLSDDFIKGGEDWVKIELKENNLYDRVLGGSPDILLPDLMLFFANAFYTLCLLMKSGKVVFKTGEVVEENIGEVARKFTETKDLTEHKTWCGLGKLFMDKFVNTYSTP